MTSGVQAAPLDGRRYAAMRVAPEQLVNSHTLVPGSPRTYLPAEETRCIAPRL
jgi:hypothetical protein